MQCFVFPLLNIKSTHISVRLYRRITVWTISNFTIFKRVNILATVQSRYYSASAAARLLPSGRDRARCTLSLLLSSNVCNFTQDHFLYSFWIASKDLYVLRLDADRGVERPQHPLDILDTCSWMESSFLRLEMDNFLRYAWLINMHVEMYALRICCR